jgi:chromosome segregation ATPase
MKLKLAIVVLFLVCVGLGIMLVLRQKNVDQQARVIEDTSGQVNSWSNQAVKVSQQLDEQKRVNDTIRQRLTAAQKELLVLTNLNDGLQGQVRKLEGDLKQTAQEARNALAAKDARITELMEQNGVVGRQLLALTNTILGLEKQIADAKSKLDSSEDDNAFLVGELKRLQAEKQDLERQFRDIAIVKAQLAELRKELNIARRLEIVRSGVNTIFSNVKGAEMLVQQPRASAKTNFGLTVEFQQNSGARVITNSVPHK